MEEPMATPEDDDPETNTEIIQDSNEALREESADRASNDWPGVERRPLLKALSAGVALSVGSGVATASDDRNSSAGNQAGGDAFLQDLTTVLSTTYKYHAIGEAVEDGYEEFGVMPPVGHIYQQADYFEGPEFTGPTELTEPPSLLFYAPIGGKTASDDFDLVLAGMEYHVSGDRTNSPPNLFADETTSYKFTVTEEEGWHRSPVPETLDVTGLHVWLYLSNPAGLFHGGNPLIEQLVN